MLQIGAGLLLDIDLDELLVVGVVLGVVPVLVDLVTADRLLLLVNDDLADGALVELGGDDLVGAAAVAELLLLLVDDGLVDGREALLELLMLEDLLHTVATLEVGLGGAGLMVVGPLDVLVEVLDHDDVLAGLGEGGGRDGVGGGEREENLRLEGNHFE